MNDHTTRDQSPKLCECGCGQPVPPSNHPYRKARYVNGHNRYSSRPISERFWEKVNKRGPDECWPWQAHVGGDGHGVFWDGTKKTSAHRFAYILVHGSVSDDIFVCHKCDNPPCCNPAHLFPGTHQDNMQDMTTKGRSSRRITQEQVDEIRRLYAAGMSQDAIAKQLHFGQSHVSRIVRNKIYVNSA